MKFTYLGTAAAEGFPAVFCNCPHCKQARVLGGRNIRTRSQAIINDDLLIDLPADTYHHFLTNGIEGDRIAYLLFTHSHSDHFYYEDLMMRHGAFAHDMRTGKLNIFCGEGVYRQFTEKGTPPNTCVTLVKPFEPFAMGPYTVTPLPARHMSGDGALIYIIKGDKTVLYAHDTGYPYEDVFDYIATCGVVFDMVSYDCTYVDIPITDEGGHMGISNIERMSARLRDMGAIVDKTVEVINHFSHNAVPLHDLLEKRVRDLGYLVSYDGMRMEI